MIDGRQVFMIRSVRNRALPGRVCVARLEHSSTTAEAAPLGVEVNGGTQGADRPWRPHSEQRTLPARGSRLA